MGLPSTASGETEWLTWCEQGAYDTSLSGWGGFSFFIGMLPSAYT